MTATLTHIGLPKVGTVVTTPSECEIAIRRELEAPRRLVWRTLTEPELVKRWLYGPDGWTFTTCEIDLRVGGAFSYVWGNADGRTMGLGGVYRELRQPERIVNTERFVGEDDSGETLVTNALVEREGRTTLTMTLRYGSRELRDEAAKSNMADGLAAAFQRVEGLLAELADEEGLR